MQARGNSPTASDRRCIPANRLRQGIAAVLLCLVGSGGVSAQEPLALREMGMFFVGGEVRETAGFEQHVDQALVHYLVPETEQPKAPVVMYPGLGLSSYIYLSTPDGREGWAQAFARRGFSAYVYDPVNTGPSGFAVGPFRSADEPAPGVNTWSIGQVWRRWGFGDAPGEPYPDARFPIDHMDQFYASWPPRVGGGGGGGGMGGAGGAGMAAGGAGMAADGSGGGMAADGSGAGMAAGGGAAMGAGGMGTGGGGAIAAGGGGMGMGGGGAAGAGGQAGGGGLPPVESNNPNVLALEALLQRTGPAVLMPHSAGGPVIFNTAQRNPDLVSAIVVLEPTGCPTAAEDVEPIAHIPFLAVYGDYIESRNQTGRLESCRATAALVREMGGRGDMLELVEEGVRGNSHMLMQDENSADIAARVMDWLDSLP